MDKYNIIEKYKNGDKVVYILSSFFVVMIAVCIFATVSITKDNGPVMEVNQISDENGSDIESEENIDKELAEDNSGQIEPEQTEYEAERKCALKVYVCGQVVKAGVYELYEGDRVIDAVEMAGGFTADAYAEAVNLSEKLMDESKVYIPAYKEVHIEEGINISSEPNITFNSGSAIINRQQIQADEVSDMNTGSTKININTANADQLTMINGIGKTRAENIIAYREKNGAFTRIEDITKVTGIGTASFEKMKEQITVE